MKIRIQTNNTALSADESTRIRQQLGLALGAHRQDIATVTMCLANLGGRAEQRLRRCLIETRLINGRFVITETADTDLALGVARVARKLAHSLEREARAAHDLERTLGAGARPTVENSYMQYAT